MVVVLNAASATAQSKEPWVDSLLSAATSEVPSLQHYLDSLGYDIDVANDELQWETLQADSGVMTARLILEIGNSSTSAYFGYFFPSDQADEQMLFRGFNEPGDSIAVPFYVPTQLGFFMTPSLPSVTQTWYTISEYNEDGYDHSWLFATGEPNTYLIAFEDLPQNGDSDFQDLVVEVTLPHRNRPPVFGQSSYGVISIWEGETISFVVSATDPDGTIPSLHVDPEIRNATLIDHQDGTGTYTFSPDYEQSDTYYLTFIAHDGREYGTAVAVIAVGHVNRAPYFDPDPSGSDTVLAGETLSLTVSAIDPDGSIPVITTGALPTNSSFADNGDGTGLFTFSPVVSQEGKHYVKFFASDGRAADTAFLTMSVVTADNAPIITPIDDVTMSEAQLLNVYVQARNPGNVQPPPALQVLNLPRFATAGAVYNGTISIRLKPEYNDAGEYDITVMAYNATDTSYLTFHVTVIDVNAQPFVFTDGSRTIYETDTLTYLVESYDADGTIPYLTAYLSAADTLATNMTFTDLRNGFGQLTFIPDLSQGGLASNPSTYYVVFKATDEEYPDVFNVSLTVTIEVIDRPAVPTIDPIGNKWINEGALLEFAVIYRDPAGAGAQLSVSPLPDHATFTDNGAGSALFSFRPDYFQAGKYWQVFRLSVGEQVVDSESVQITVVNVNRAPYVYAPDGSLDVLEGSAVSVRVNAFDADSTIPFLSAYSDGGGELAGNMVFVDSGNGVGALTFAPDYDQGGSGENPATYPVRFRATDAEYPDDWTESPALTFRVIDVNPPPVLNPIGLQEATAGTAFELIVTAYDILGDPLTLTTSSLPGDAVFTDRGDGTGQLVYTPSAEEIGVQTVTFYASDGENTVSEEVTITVLRVNSDPYFGDIPAEVDAVEWAPLVLVIAAYDNDDDALELSCSGNPEGAVLIDNGDGSGRFEFTPDYRHVDQSYDLEFEVSDGRSTAVAAAHLRVLNAPLQVGQTGDDADILIDGAITLTFSEPISEPTVAAGVLYVNRLGSSLQVRHVSGGDHSQVVIEPIPGGAFIPMDTIRVTVNQYVRDLAGYALTQDYSATFTVGAEVFPGDTNNDGVVDERDILPIGTYFGRVGPSRPAPGIDWGSKSAHVRGDISVWAPYRSVYADADGSGTVDADDICAVSTNWGQVRPGAALSGVPRPSPDELTAALGDGRLMSQLAAALADCPLGAGRDVLLEQLTSQSDPGDALPTDFALYQNYPNPFNAGTMIGFALSEPSRVSLTVYNMMGQRVATLVDQTMPAGVYNVHWDGRDDGGSEVASGVYLYRIDTDINSVSKRMLLLK